MFSQAKLLLIGLCLSLPQPSISIQKAEVEFKPLKCYQCDEGDDCLHKDPPTEVLLILIQVEGANSLPDLTHLKPGDLLEGTYPASLRLIGTVEGKVYFAENTTTMDWHQAKKYCSDLGMRLGSIDSPGQADFLDISYAPHFSGFFWTSGRDSNLLRQFSWDLDQTQRELDETYLDFFPSLLIRTALFYYSNEGASFLSDHVSTGADCVAICETSI